jgi:hypothetical protein
MVNNIKEMNNHLLPQLSEHMKRPWQGNEQPPLTSTQWTYEKTMTRKW